MNATITPVPLPVPDPTSVATWPAAAVAIALILGGVAVQIANLVVTMQLRIQAAKAPTGAEIVALGGKVDALSVEVHAHVAEDAAWKQAAEKRLPAIER
jgi:hypothetical protein